MRKIVSHLHETKLGGTGRQVAKAIGMDPKTATRALEELHRIPPGEWNRRGPDSKRAKERRGDAIVCWHHFLRVWYHQANKAYVNGEWRTRRSPSSAEFDKAARAHAAILEGTRKPKVRWGYRFFLRHPRNPLRLEMEQEGVDFSTIESFVRTIARHRFAKESFKAISHGRLDDSAFAELERMFRLRDDLFDRGS